MNKIIPTIATAALFAFASAAGAQEVAKPASDPIKAVSDTAEGRLAASIAELNALRDQIAAEKLPIATELTALEDRVTGLRKENERLTRLVDAGALEIAQIRQEIKARQDELGYVGNLLDEYARSFETRIGVGELQAVGATLTAAKEAPENKTLSTEQRFDLQTGFVDASIKRLFDAVGGSRFAGVGVDMLGTVANGQFALIGPVSLFRGDNGVSGIAVAQSGSDKPLIRPLEGEMAPLVGALVATGEGTLPLDPSRGGALKALVQKLNLVHIFIKGGPIMWPILVASILALGVVIERVIFLLNDRRLRSRRALNQFLGEVEKGNLDAAIQISHKTRDCIATTLGYALEHREHSLNDALDYAKSRTLKRFRRGIAILDTIITLAPLLGLLGTVTGMMGSFAVIGGDLSSPGAITGGIAEALIATAAGLGIAILCLLPFNYLNTRIEVIENELDSAGAHLRLAFEKVQAKSSRGHRGHGNETSVSAASVAGGA
jgi:biopolymer transport protein ExbB